MQEDCKNLECKNCGHHKLEATTVGVGVCAEGGGFEDSTELKRMKFKEAMATKERDKWL